MMQLLYARPFFCCCLLAFLLFSSQYPLLDWSQFSDDDTHILQLALSYDWLSPYIDPLVYQQLSIVHFTPLVLSAYRAVITLFGLNAQAFIAIQLFFIALLCALAGYYVWRTHRRLSAATLTIVLIFSSASLLPMLSRFYTLHYILGGIFTVLALLLIQRRGRYSALTLGALFSCTLLALLAKEIYLMAVPLLWLLLWRNKAIAALVSVSLALSLYMALRLYHLGFSTDGRDGQSLLAGLFNIDAQTWLNFGQWYLSNKGIIVVFSVLALLRTPAKMALYLPLAALFLLPTLAAPHAFQVPQLHGDRLFFGFDCALVIAAVLALYTKPLPRQGAIVISVTILLFSFGLQRHMMKDFSAQQMASPAYKITQYILTATPHSPTTLLTPLTYLQGEFGNIYKKLDNPWLSVTQNCQQALSAIRQGQRLVIFDQHGQQIKNEGLTDRCQSAENVATLVTPPEFHRGVLKWQIDVPASYTAGVQLIDRGITIAIPTLQQRLVRPKPGERYQLFTRKDNLWWFSAIATIHVY